MTSADRHRNAPATCAQVILGICALGLVVTAPIAVARSGKSQVGSVTDVDGPPSSVYVRGEPQDPGDTPTLFEGDPIRTAKGGAISFDIKANHVRASCTSDEPTRLQVAPRKKKQDKKLLILFSHGASFCSTQGQANGKRFGFSGGKGFGNLTVEAAKALSVKPTSGKNASRVAAGPDLRRRPTFSEPVFKVVIRNKQIVVEVTRGVAVISTNRRFPSCKKLPRRLRLACDVRESKKRAVVVGCSRPKGSPARVKGYAERVVVLKGGPKRPKCVKSTRAEKKAFTGVAAELPPVRPLDLEKPKTKVINGPTDPSARAEATFTFTADEAGVVYSCSIDGGVPLLCSSPIEYRGLRDGNHTFSVDATDMAGNVSETQFYRWTVDTTPPRASILAKPPDPASGSSSSRAVFAFVAKDENKTTFSCALNGDTFVRCSSPKAYSNLDLGRHTFSVKATDSAGNSGSASYSWTIVNASSAIAFESNRNGRHDIYVINPDGSSETRLTNDPGEDVDPAWSPDGKKLAFESDRDSRQDSEIYVMNADGSGQIRLTTNPATDRNPKWSPFGKQIAFESDRDGNREIYVMNADGSGQPRRLTTASAEDSDPAWSPDGSRIAFVSNRDGNMAIYVMNADGSGRPRRLTTNSFEEVNPVWSPDGRKIAFESDRDGNHEIYVMNADGSGQTRLTTNAARDSDPDWSPRGDEIAFASERDGNLEIYVMNDDGSRPRRLTNSPGRDLVPNW